MSKYLASLRQNRLVTSSIVFASLIFLVASVWASTRVWVSNISKAQEIKPRIINKTTSLQVVSVEKTNGQFPDLKVTLSNNSFKNISAYVLSVGDLNVMNYSGFNEEPFSPGQTKVEKLPYGNFEATAERDPKRAGVLVVSAVYFDDQSNEGDLRQINMIKDNYTGIKEQLNLILPLLRSALSSVQSDPERTFLTLETQVAHLPTDVGNAKVSADYRSGRAWVQESLSMEIQNLGRMNRANVNPELDHTMDLNNLIKSCERYVEKHYPAP